MLGPDRVGNDVDSVNEGAMQNQNSVSERYNGIYAHAVTCIILMFFCAVDSLN